MWCCSNVTLFKFYTYYSFSPERHSSFLSCLGRDCRTRCSQNSGIAWIRLTPHPLIQASWAIWPIISRKCDSRQFSTKVRKSFLRVKMLNRCGWMIYSGGKGTLLWGNYHFWVMNDHLWGPSVHVDKSFTKIQARVRPPPHSGNACILGVSGSATHP